MFKKSTVLQKLSICLGSATLLLAATVVPAMEAAKIDKQQTAAAVPAASLGMTSQLFSGADIKAIPLANESGPAGPGIRGGRYQGGDGNDQTRAIVVGDEGDYYTAGWNEIDGENRLVVRRNTTDAEYSQVWGFTFTIGGRTISEAYGITIDRNTNVVTLVGRIKGDPADSWGCFMLSVNGKDGSGVGARILDTKADDACYAVSWDANTAALFIHGVALDDGAEGRRGLGISFPELASDPNWGPFIYGSVPNLYRDNEVKGDWLYVGGQALNEDVVRALALRVNPFDGTVSDGLVLLTDNASEFRGVASDADGSTVFVGFLSGDDGGALAVRIDATFSEVLYGLVFPALEIFNGVMQADDGTTHIAGSVKTDPDFAQDGIVLSLDFGGTPINFALIAGAGFTLDTATSIARTAKGNPIVTIVTRSPDLSLARGLVGEQDGGFVEMQGL